jgi:hypothetical protein
MPAAPSIKRNNGYLEHDMRKTNGKTRSYNKKNLADLPPASRFTKRTYSVFATWGRTSGFSEEGA